MRVVGAEGVWISLTANTTQCMWKWGCLAHEETGDCSAA